MAELIHTFTGGKMNKDLDERLVPNGEYRDALNLEIASSENSQVGTFQNIKGNLELLNKTYDPTTGGYTQWSPSEYIQSNGGTAICIGSIADENSDEIYWFIASAGTSIIASYNTKTKLTLPLLVDTQNVLNFSSSYLITGINVLEGMLIWTDNQTEPKKILIKDWVNSTSNFVTHSQIYGRNFIEDDLTVIKKYPLQPPTITAYSTKVLNADGTPGANVDTLVNYAFTETPNGAPAGTIVPMTPESGPQTLTWITNVLPVYQQGDILVLTNSENDPLDTDAVIRVEVLSIVGNQTGAIVQVLSVGVGAETQTLDPTVFDVTLEQEPAFFEMRFARFGYRYKYKNNELSAFSPFSNPAFLPGEFNYAPQQGYNLGMVNNIRQLSISNFKADPVVYPDVIAVDILYKATNNSNVYVVDTFESTDPEWTTNSFNIESEIITSVVNANQLLRPYDNVPRKALAQEVTANRLIFGNYTQNFNLLNLGGSSFNTTIEVGQNTSTVSAEFDDFGNALGVSIDNEQVAESVKSIRTYQIGVAYIDKYGRTTPVFTSKQASVTIPKANALMSTKLTAQLSFNPDGNSTLIPYYYGNKQFPYFKYYVKETSQEYYNLALDRFYDAEDGNLWLSFPSAERNKVDEDTFIILKKEHANADPVTQDARYKVIAIENEAPTYLKETKLSMGKLDTQFAAGGFPLEGTNEVWVNKDKFDEQFGIESRTVSGLLMRVVSGATVSNYYKISTFGLDNTGTPSVRITVSTAFGPDMNFTSTEPYGYPNAVPALKLELFKVELQNKPEFTGRFFVKVYQDALLEEKIANANATASANYIRKALGYCYYSTGTHNSSSYWGKGNYGGNNWTRSDAQNSGERLFIDEISCEGLNMGTGLTEDKVMQISYAGGYGQYRSDGLAINNPPLLEQLDSGGALFRFIDAGNGKVDPQGTIYQMTNSSKRRKYTYYERNWYDDFGNADNTTNQITRWTINFRVADSEWQGIQWDPTSDDGGIIPWQNGQNNYDPYYIGIEFIEVSGDDDSFTTNNPAVFETEPKEAAELDIYYEIPKIYEKSEAGNIHTLDFFNCYSFGNGVESDRIRDDYNQPTIENGVKASATLDEPYAEEHRGNGLIFSQIFNSTSGVNGLNQFIQAESITKDVNPEYGSIQKLHSRDTNLVTLCENKSMKILANKDALFNADGSSNVTSNQAVLGQTVTFQGEFGIATNPESFAEFGFRMYYTDANRGTVIRLSNDGITEVSDYGMHSFFSDNLKLNSKIVGTWDMEKKNYNVTLSALTPYWQQTLGAGDFDRTNPDPACGQFLNTKPTTSTTISYKEDVNGWTSRKVYIPESGVYLNNVYYTFKDGRAWEHNANTLYNTFYDRGPSGNRFAPYYESSFTTIFNEQPSSVKGFKTVNYSGTDSREYIYRVGASLQTYSLAQVQAQQLMPTSFATTKGWYLNSIITDLQEGEVKEFIDKEGKYFNYIKGLNTFFDTNCDTNVDSHEFNVQGIGKASVIVAPDVEQFTVTNQMDPDCFSGIVPPVLENQNFTGVEDTAGSFTIAETNTCSAGITFTLINNSTTGGDLALNSNGTFTFNPNLNYNGDAGSFTVVACCGDVCSEPAQMSINILPIAENPYFTTDYPTTTGLVVGDVWTYNPIGIDDPDHTPSQLFIATPVPNLPSWMNQPAPLNDGSGNWYIAPSTVVGANPIDFTMTVVDPDGNQGTQQIVGDSILSGLLDLEFLVTTRTGQSSRTYTNPTTGQATAMTAMTNASYHGCNRGTYKLLGNTTLVGRVYVGNAYETRDFDWATNAFDGDQLYDTYTVDGNGNASSITGDVEGSTSIPSAVAQGVTNTLLIDCSVAGVTCQKYITANDNFSYYANPLPQVPALAGLPNDRYNLVTITPAIAQQIIDQSSGPNPEIVSFGIAVDTYEANGVLNTHGDGVYLQVFKDGAEIYSQAQPNGSAVTINVLTGEIL